MGKEQRSKVSTYCNQVEPLGEIISSKTTFRTCEKEEGLSVKPQGITVQVNCFLPSEGKKVLVSFINGNVKECTLHKSVTVKKLLPVGWMLVVYEG